MITVIGLDGSPLSRRAAEAVASATLLVGGRRHLATAGCLREEPTWPAPPADPDSAVITAGGPAARPSPHGTSPVGAGPGGTGPTSPEAPHSTSTSPTGTTPSHRDSARPAAARPRVVVLGPLRPALDALTAHEGDAVVLASGDPAPHPTSTNPRGASPDRTDPARASATRPRVVELGPLRPALDALAAHEGDAVVLASGDPAASPGGPHPTSTNPRGASPDRTDPARASATRPRVVELGPLRPALDALAAHEGDAVVLASGDPGFFGVVRALRERGLDYVVLPATSSVAQAFARAGMPWDDAMVVSAHGRELRAAVNVCRAHPKVAVLTGPGQGPAEIGAALAGWPRRLLVAEDLGGPGERITECTPAAAAERTWADPSVVLSLADPRPAPPAPAPPVPAPSAATPAPSGGAGESVINRLVLPQRHQSVDHEEDGPPDDPTNFKSHTGPRRRVAEPPGPTDPFVIMTLVSPERHLSHDHERGSVPGVPSSLANHTSLSGLGPGGGGPGSGGPDTGGLTPGGSGPSWCWPLWAGVGDQGWALGEEVFEHRDSMVTKPEVRALALARLGPRPGMLVWDIGAGSGSVAVECARFGAAVIAVDREPAQCARVAANARRHGAEVRVVGGTAPEALDALPDPDAVFVGGGGLAVVSAVAARRPARIVVALAAVQRAGPALEALAGTGYTVDGTLLQASRLAPLPDGAHRLAAANPVFLLWADRDGAARDGAARDGTGRDGAGRDGADRDGAGRDGAARDGTGRDGAGRDHDHGQMGAL